MGGYGKVLMNLNPEDSQRYLEEFAASIEQGRRLVQGKGQFMGPILMRAEGINANLLLLDDRVRIQRREETNFPQGFRGNRDILFSQIATINLKRATTMGNGFIQFLLSGRNDTGDHDDAVRDENTVMFKGAHQAEFDRIKAAIEMKIATARTVAARPQARTASYIEELEQLAKLRDKGIITEEEFAAKKRQILGI
jgi:hypothetical protein